MRRSEPTQRRKSRTASSARTAASRRSRRSPAPGWDRIRIVAFPQFDAVDDAALADAAGLGFDAVLAHSLSEAPGAGELPQALAVDTVRQAARRAHAAGLRLLLDIRMHRVGRDSKLVRRRPSWFRQPVVPEWPVDPRREFRVAEPLPRFEHDEAAAAFGDWFEELLRDAVAAGADGFVASTPQRVPADLWSRITARVRGAHRRAFFIASAPGMTSAERGALSSAGFDACLCSLPWWDYRAPWFAEELTELRRAGGIIAPVALAAEVRGEHGDDVAGLLRRAVACARACADGWLLETRHGIAGGAEDDGRIVLPDPLRDIVAAANDGFVAADFAAREVRLVSAPWARVGAWLERSPAGARMTLINNDPAHHASLPVAALENSAGTVIGAESIAFTPGEVRVLELEPVAPVRPAPVAKALDAALAAPRIAIEDVQPAVDDGRFDAKRTLGETMTVEADVFTDGHPTLRVNLLWRAADSADWNRVRMRALGNDRWRGEFPLRRLGRHVFAVEAGIDEFGGLRSDLEKKLGAAQPVASEVAEVRQLIERSARRAAAPERARLRALLRELDGAAEPALHLLGGEWAGLMAAAAVPAFLTRSPKEYGVFVERDAARNAAWYELFPRSQGRAGRHGTFRDVIAQLPRIAAMGFDVLYFTPIHPIGTTNRKGANNSLRAGPGEPGSVYAVGAAEGGHDALHPQLGTLADFRALVEAARGHGLEIALDVAVQCSPDHPWIREHPDWFAWRPDGTLRYAENPPKKYEDIVNVDFYAKGARPKLWTALRDVFAFWMGHGVKTFRVDNPHTKPLPFWEWLIADLRALDPEVILLSEAFTRPKLMYRLAKLGYAQSYTYFTWRNTRAELEAYLTELNAAPVRDFFRPHFFVNTPDINPVFLQKSGRAGFLIRAALAATLSGLWGMYSGFELCEAEPLPGREEYLDSEKYQLRHRNWQAPGNIGAEITRLNRIRRANPALHSHLGVTFHPSSNSNVIWFAKSTPSRDNVVLVAVCLDPFQAQETDVELPLWDWGLDDNAGLCAEDLLTDRAFLWRGKRQHLRIDPATGPYRIWRVRPERER